MQVIVNKIQLCKLLRSFQCHQDAKHIISTVSIFLHNKLNSVSSKQVHLIAHIRVAQVHLASSVLHLISTEMRHKKWKYIEKHISKIVFPHLFVYVLTHTHSVPVSGSGSFPLVIHCVINCWDCCYLHWTTYLVFGGWIFLATVNKPSNSTASGSVLEHMKQCISKVLWKFLSNTPNHSTSSYV